MYNLKLPLFAGLLIAGTLLISSCSSSENEGIPVQGKTGKNQEKNDETMNSVIGEGIAIGGMTAVMYPLTYAIATKKEKGGIGISKSYARSSSGPYWNIAFYDPNTGNSNLLDSGHVMRINSFEQLKGQMMYMIKYTDYNGDGQLDHEDPTYLFVSDLGGRNFKQITPDGLHISGLQVIAKSSAVLIQGITDSNHDKKFDESDDIVPMIYNPEKADVAKETIGKSGKNEISKVFNKLYQN